MDIRLQVFLKFLPRNVVVIFNKYVVVVSDKYVVVISDKYGQKCRIPPFQIFFKIFLFISDFKKTLKFAIQIPEQPPYDLTWNIMFSVPKTYIVLPC